MGKMTCIAVDVWVGKPVLRFSLSNTGPSCVQNEPNLVTFHINTIFHVVELLGIAFCPLTSRKYTLLVQKTSESSSCCNFAKSMSSCEPLVKVMQWFSITYHFRSNDFTHSFFSYPNICLSRHQPRVCLVLSGSMMRRTFPVCFIGIWWFYDSSSTSIHLTRHD